MPLSKVNQPIVVINNDLPITLVWGVFCRRVLVDRDTNLSTIVDLHFGVMYFEVAFSTTNPVEEEMLSIGDITIFTLFNTSGLDAGDLQLNASITSKNKDIQLLVNLLIEKDKQFSNSIIRLQNFLVKVDLHQDLTEDLIKVKYDCGGKEVGTLEMPIKITVSKVESD